MFGGQTKVRKIFVRHLVTLVKMNVLIFIKLVPGVILCKSVATNIFCFCHFLGIDSDDVNDANDANDVSSGFAF